MNKFILITLGVMLLLGCVGLIYSENSTVKAKRIYDIPLRKEIGAPVKVVANKESTLVFEYAVESLRQLVKVTDAYGYGQWQKLSEQISYGNSTIVVDGYVSRNVIFSEKPHGHSKQLLFIDFDANRLIMLFFE